MGAYQSSTTGLFLWFWITSWKIAKIITYMVKDIFVTMHIFKRYLIWLNFAPIFHWLIYYRTGWRSLRCFWARWRMGSSSCPGTRPTPTLDLLLCTSCFYFYAVFFNQRCIMHIAYKLHWDIFFLLLTDSYRLFSDNTYCQIHKMTEVEEKSWELSLYESLRTPQEAITDNTGIFELQINMMQNTMV